MEHTPDTQWAEAQIIESDEPLGEAPEGVSPQLWTQWQDEEALKKDQFLYQLKRGAAGHNIGLDNGLQLVNRYIYGTHKARYYLIGAESSAGKTTIADFMYVLNAWKSAKAMGRRIKIFYLSFEIGRTDKLYRWASYYIFAKYGERLPSDYLQGRIHGKLPSKVHQQWALEAYTIILDMLQDVKVVEGTMHPTKIFEGLIDEHYAKHGTVQRAEVSEEDKKKHKKGFVTGYQEEDPDMITILFVDHLALAASEQHLDTKGIMDRLSKYMIVLRNMFHCTGVFIQQFSTDMMSTYRGLLGKKTEGSITPQRIDFGDSKATFRDADVVFGAVKPQMENFHGIVLDKTKGGMGDCFVAWYLMKNRYGPSNRLIPLFMDGISGHIYDLPFDQPDQMKDWYEKAQKIEALCQVFSPKSV